MSGLQLGGGKSLLPVHQGAVDSSNTQEGDVDEFC